MEAPAHGTVVQRVGDRDDGHALVMGHVGADDGNIAALGQTGLGIVQRVIPAVAAARADCGETGQVMQCGRRVHHRRERCCVRGDDGVVAQATLEPQVGNAKAAVLIGEFQVARIVRGFRRAPRNAARGTVFHLLIHDHVARLLQQAPRGGAHDQRRHQVFEHRPGPGDQRRIVPNRRQRTAEAEPVAGRQVAFGDCDEARKTRLRREQIVIAGVESAIGNPISDR